MFFLALSIAFSVKIHWIILECLISILDKLPCVSVEKFCKSSFTGSSSKLCTRVH